MGYNEIIVVGIKQLLVLGGKNWYVFTALEQGPFRRKKN